MENEITTREVYRFKEFEFELPYWGSPIIYVIFIVTILGKPSYSSYIYTQYCN